MAVSKVILNGTTLIDTTDKTVTAGGMLSGVTALKNDGTSITGNIASKTSSDLTASGATVTAPAGYYSSAASKAVSNGSATTPATSITANPSISVSSGGLITASVSASKNVTPAVSAGYVSSGTAGTVSVSGSNTSQLTAQAAQTIHPSTTDQTIASGKYLTGAQTVKGVLLTNLSAGNIKKDVVVKVGDSTDDDCVTSVTGTYEGGGGGGPVEKKQVNFIDYDGTLLYSYTKVEANALSALPANPSHTGLTAQGWNWTLAQIKAQLTAMPDADVWVGQMYITSSGKTEIDVSMPDGRLSPILTIAVDGTVEVDWGDNTTPDTVTGTSTGTRLDSSHTYASAGDYTISISVTSGSFVFWGSSIYTLLRKNNTANENKVYANCIKSVRLGSGISSIWEYAFYYCSALSTITIPSGVTQIWTGAFYHCAILSTVIVPSGVTSVANSVFYECSSLSSVSIPSGVTSIGSGSFQYCYALQAVTVPSGVTSIGDNAFYYCYTLPAIIFPSGVTSIGTTAFRNCCALSTFVIPSGASSVAGSMFYNCYALSSVTIPSGVTSVGDSAFYNCYDLSSVTIPSEVTSIGKTVFVNCCGVKEYHIKPTTVPSLGTSVFNNIPSDCVIYVPTAKLSDYQGASNWSTYASYMQGE